MAWATAPTSSVGGISRRGRREKLTAKARSLGVMTLSRKPAAAFSVSTIDPAIDPDVSIRTPTTSGRFCTSSNLAISCFFADSRTSKSSCFRSVTKLPERSVTATYISTRLTSTSETNCGDLRYRTASARLSSSRVATTVR
jgi:hypothetical protein